MVHSAKTRGGSFAVSSWHSETRSQRELDAKLTEKNFEFAYQLAPGATQCQSVTLDQEYLLRASYGAVVDGSPSRKALAHCRMEIIDQRRAQPLRELPLDMITVQDPALQAQVDRLERMLTYLVSRANHEGIDDAEIREALSRLGYRPTARDLREFSPAIVVQQGRVLSARVIAAEDVDFEPFTWRLIAHGAYTGR